MDAWKERLVDEYTNLKVTLKRVHEKNLENAVLVAKSIEGLDSSALYNINLLNEQEEAMTKYLQCLELRAKLNDIEL